MVKHSEPQDDYQTEGAIEVPPEVDDAETARAIVPVDDEAYTLAMRESLDKLERDIQAAPLKTADEIRREKGLPVHVSTEEMSEYRSIVIARKTSQKALLPESGEVTDGYVVLWRPTDKPGEWYTTFIGGQVLVRDLRLLTLPFKTRLVKRGRAWTFSG